MNHGDNAWLKNFYLFNMSPVISLNALFRRERVKKFLINTFFKSISLLNNNDFVVFGE